MSVPQPDELYGRALAGGELYLRGEDGSRRRLPLERWLAPLHAADRRVLARAGGPVLDVGCGPGRHVSALARQGVLALGVDIAPLAVLHARSLGARAVLGSVFDPIPGADHWRTALLLDGNIGIGGRPRELLRRVGELLGSDGAILCELGAPGSPTRSELVALEDRGGLRSSWFPWARVSVDAAAGLAASQGMRLREQWCDEGRWFAEIGSGAPR
jgi:SAM-dependent methyltransferase